ncbi:hypothetical protein MGN70_010139 [Eutypa lata]|nr:hypothetical protein MGN70_010139 [Eutypa lata]
MTKNQSRQIHLAKRVKNREFFKPNLCVGRSVDLINKLCGPGGKLEKKLGPYQAAIKQGVAAQLSVWGCEVSTCYSEQGSRVPERSSICRVK